MEPLTIEFDENRILASMQMGLVGVFLIIIFVPFLAFAIYDYLYDFCKKQIMQLRT